MSNPLNHAAAGAALLLTLTGGPPGEAPLIEAQTLMTRPDDGALVRLTVGGTPDRAVVELIATRPLSSRLHTVGDPPNRLFVDLLHIVPEVPDSTEVNLGAVKRVRVALNQSAPPVTRVVLDVDGATRFDISEGPTGHALRITVEADLPTVEKDAETYAAWFTRTSAAITRLLAVTANVITTSERTGDEEIALEWDALRHHLDAVTPPADLAPAHELLVTATSVGHAAITGADERLFPTGDVASATAGAAILVRQAERLAGPHLTAPGDEPALP